MVKSGSAASADLRLGDVLDSISRGTSKAREQGLIDLISIISSRHLQTFNLEKLGDSAFHEIFDVLFKQSLNEKQLYLGAKKNTTAKSAARLSLCAEAVFVTAKAGTSKLKRKTLQAVIEHITQSLTSASETYCQPLAIHYLKALAAILGHSAHVEHLPKDLWLSTVDFCLHGINFYYRPEDPVDGASSLRSLDIMDALSSSAKRSASDSRKNLTRRNTEELLECLLYLISSPNSPVLEVAGEVVIGVTLFLHCQGATVSQPHQVGFAVMNVIISATLADDVSLTKRAVRDLIPIISRLWSSKFNPRDEMLNSAKDEMLIFLLSSQLVIERLAKDENEDFVIDLRDLRDSMRTEYSRRTDSDQLQLDDLNLSSLNADTSANESMTVSLIRLQVQDQRSERNWTILQILGFLEAFLYDGRATEQSTRPNLDEVQQEHPSKRRRVERRTNGSLQQSIFLRLDLNNTRLETLIFALETTSLSFEELDALLMQLLPYINDKKGDVASWAMLVIASCAYQVKAVEGQSTFDWTGLWHICARFITAYSTCRAACHLMHTMIAKGLVQYRNIAEDVNAIVVSIDISAPAILCDSSLLLMTHLLNLRNVESPGDASTACQSVIRWVSSRWNPFDKQTASSFAFQVHPIDIINLLRTCLRLFRIKLPPSDQLPGGRIHRVTRKRAEVEEAVRYLLLLEKLPSFSTVCPSCPSYRSSRDENYIATTIPLRRLIHELFLPRFQTFLKSMEAYEADQSLQISVDMLKIAVSTCVFGSLLSSMLREMAYAPSGEFQDCVREISRAVIRFLSNGIGAINSLEVVLHTLAPYLPSIASDNLHDFLASHSELTELLVALSDEISQRQSLTQETTGGVMSEAMDLDDGFTSQQSHPRQDMTRHDKIRVLRDLTLHSSPAAYYSAISARVVYASATAKAAAHPTSMTSIFLDYVLSLGDNDFILCSNAIIELVSSDSSLAPSDMHRLLQRIGELIGGYEHDCCESSLVFCVDILTALVPFWSHEETGTAIEAAVDLYGWFITVALPKKRLSTPTHIRISELLHRLLVENPRFSEGSMFPSLRSTLLEILQRGSALVKYHIGQKVSIIFKIHVLKLHDDILTDVLDSLPSDPDWYEGIALRLYIIGKLASTWPTLLRRCVYHIFEIPGRIQRAHDHARRCLLTVSNSLKLRDARELFRIFASQLLYTWLETEPIGTIPFTIFGYDSLVELIQDVQEEAVGLMIMRSQDDDAQDLSKLLGTPFDELLKRSFTKVIGYSVAHDISVPHTDGSKKYVSGEARVRKILGKTNFYGCMNKHFVDIVALFFSMIDQDGAIEKSFVKEPKLVYAADIIKEIKSTSASNNTLPPSQQPAFKARYLTSEIEHLCGRTEYDVTQLYTPTIVVFIVRRLMDSIHPALGSLHACSILRKLRLLIALSGSTALRDYPTEMLLRSIRPLISDPECADDALGITQYLFEKGSAHLSKHPTFMTGISLSLLISLRSFLDSTQSSTTQDSQYKLTMFKAQNFHLWLSQFLARYESPSLSKNSSARFKLLIRSACGIRNSGNAERGTAESNLMFEILKDYGSEQQLLDEPSRDLTLSLLSSGFSHPASFRDDIMGSDSNAAFYAPAICRFYQRYSAGESFTYWAARVLGRAFAATGNIELDFMRESTLRRVRLFGRSNPSSSSRSSILDLLQAITMRDDERSVSVAEAALRVIVSAEYSWNRGEDYIGISEQLTTASIWQPYHPPPSDEQLRISSNASLDGIANIDYSISEPEWLLDVACTIANSAPSDIVLSTLPKVLRSVDVFCEEAFPFILHQVLSLNHKGHQTSKMVLSIAFCNWLREVDKTNSANIKHLINAILYLRTQPLPQESSSADRTHWLEIDYREAAKAAVVCGMFKTALLFIEISISESSRVSRRTSSSKNVDADTNALLLSIFDNIDSPDFYYGVKQDASLQNISARLEFERDGAKALSFRGAQYDSYLRAHDNEAQSDVRSLVGALSMLSLDGLSRSLLQTQDAVNLTQESIDSMFLTARRLEDWDIPVPVNSTSVPITLYKAFQAINTDSEGGLISGAINSALVQVMTGLGPGSVVASSLPKNLRALATLTEMDEVVNCRDPEQFKEVMERFQSRSAWMKTGRFEDVSHIISCRETIMSSVGRRQELQHIMNVSATDARLVEVQTNLLSASLNRAHGALQESLTSATHLTQLIIPLQRLGLNVDAAAHLEAANALWEQGEMASSIGMLQALNNSSSLPKQLIPVGKSDLLAKIGYQVSVARLEKPDRIIENYLVPALNELKGQETGSEAGHVFHEFAMFCDQQLENSDNLEDLERLRKLKQMKETEVRELNKMYKSAGSSDHKQRYKGHLGKAKQWLELDDQEYRRLCLSRDEFLQKSLENYLLALRASDDHDGDVLRCSALWLEHSDQDLANSAVSRHIEKVPSRKFAPLMNQLTSRLLDNQTTFQLTLFSLVLAICTDHPYHGMHQIWAGCKSKISSRDDTAISRQRATKKVAKLLGESTAITKIWQSVDKTSSAYCHLAAEKDPEKYKAGRKFTLKDSPASFTLNNLLPRYPTPPPTMQTKIAADLDYSKIPMMHKLEQQMSIASGVSAPKIITVIATDGTRFRQLVKGGNDDLRQDAIMEQVFAQVSELLKRNRSTRQRNLGIRTYKVLPLTSAAGIIEFVPNTIPLHEYLMPAHERYYPKDLRGKQCREQISNVQAQRLETKVKTYRAITERFHPVMRYFFTEKFEDPDDWFHKRLAYTRSTAAISILGYILGLGDRHGHNILLDEETGEVVHIDLGIAFEMGRVLPVPEVVPFRLTRDIVDGMGITGTEGVFRRCCEFTLEALRKESYSIMTILDVLRYDPLYSWSISPVRLAKLQDAQSAALVPQTAGAEVAGTSRAKETVNEPGEADRALTVVSKKLSKALSVTATVNDLINQATDERNLAALYCGWAAYA